MGLALSFKGEYVVYLPKQMRSAVHTSLPIQLPSLYQTQACHRHQKVTNHEGEVTNVGERELSIVCECISHPYNIKNVSPIGC